jgi:hypothetical protein
MRTLALPALVAALLLAASPVVAGRWGGRAGRPGVEIEDRIDLIQVDRRILAIDSRSNREKEFTLDVNEQLLGLDSRGAVAVVRTNQRLLGLTTEHASWQELRYRVGERRVPPEDVYLGDRVLAVPLDNRLVALSTTSDSWQMLELGAREQMRRALADNNLVAVVTQRRAIAFSVTFPNFVEVTLTPQEEIENTSVNDSSITVVTSRRILIYRAGAGVWTDRNRKNRIRR